MSIKIYTKTKHFKTKKNTYSPKMWGVIEGPIHLMMRDFSKEFAFIRHESKRSLRPSARSKAEAKPIENNES